MKGKTMYRRLLRAVPDEPDEMLDIEQLVADSLELVLTTYERLLGVAMACHDGSRADDDQVRMIAQAYHATNTMIAAMSVARHPSGGR
jgi:hypothetical protein